MLEQNRKQFLCLTIRPDTNTTQQPPTNQPQTADAALNYQLSINTPWQNQQILQPELRLSLDLKPRPNQEPDWQVSINNVPINLDNRNVGVDTADNTRHSNCYRTC